MMSELKVSIHDLHKAFPEWNIGYVATESFSAEFVHRDHPLEFFEGAMMVRLNCATDLVKSMSLHPEAAPKRGFWFPTATLSFASDDDLIEFKLKYL
ncbi:hypothetical protein OKW76_00405 [Sphingomonas sp. S1-29]|uniref:hypothetical protein n=1 Tax=Sphingomonas sp. S1-29 TaxID=2991074 RepID=UPI00223FFC4E|nr:hypothetical protein [Sphingomonas sp. S1-29]UZK69586.1 hypothetical protein OKW76_00405 [Sphingomonas sp. S1-29]